MAPRTSDLIDGRAGDDRQRRIERKMADEYGEPAKHHAFQFGQQPITPIQRRLQGPLTRWRGARPQPQQRQALVEKRSGLLQAIGLDASGGQLDRERHTVELPADARHDRGFRVAEVQARATRHRALDEQLGRGERPGDRRREPRVVGRTSRAAPICGRSRPPPEELRGSSPGYGPAARPRRSVPPSRGAASMRCSQVSRIKRMRLSRRYAIRLGVASSD